MFQIPMSTLELGFKLNYQHFKIIDVGIVVSRNFVSFCIYCVSWEVFRKGKTYLLN